MLKQTNVDRLGLKVDLFGESREASALSPPANALRLWEPGRWPVAGDWQAPVSDFFQSQAGRRLGEFMQARLAAGATIFPATPLRALQLTPLAKVRIVILGQDPYHGPGQAHGLAFSVTTGTPVPPSLRNIYKEIDREAGCGLPQTVAMPGTCAPRADGNLERWARQGVLLLNTCLTVEQGLPASHAQQGWEVLTDTIIQLVWASQFPVVFLLWGAHAQARKALLTPDGGKSDGAAPASRHLVLTANHPSPLSALRPPKPFLGCDHFAKANVFVHQNGGVPIDW